MEKIVEELKKIITFKETTGPGDVVLVVVEEPQSVFYGVVSDISRDPNKRDEWWRLTMNVLSVPPQKIVWILRESQFTGQEIFTMGGVGRFIKALDFSGVPDAESRDLASGKKSQKTAGKKRPALRVVK